MSQAAHECPECTFVASRESIFVDQKRRERASSQPELIGKYSLLNWSGHLSFYLCRCSCGRAFVDYAHGYTDGGRLFFNCDGCGAIVIIDDKKVYKESGVGRPSLLGALWTIVTLRFKRKKPLAELPK